jgi:peptide/nickel transport system ATP-binding protein
MPDERQVLLKAVDLKMHFPIRRGFLRRVVGTARAVDGVNLDIYEGETVGLVGESGCGKTTLGRLLLRAIEPTGGQIFFRQHRNNGDLVETTALSQRELKPLRREMQIIFQDPYSSLDPRMTVLDIIAEPLRVQGVRDKEQIRAQVRDLLIRVGLRVQHMNRYPHAFSGGQRQRIGIARALALQPRLIIADEPVSALDVSIQAQILNLLRALQQQFDLTYLFISHDLSVVQHISDRVAVMYLGSIVEMAATDELFAKPRHPYTEALLAAVPRADPDQPKRRFVLPGDVPNPANPPPGCRFHPRCRYAKEICRRDTPALREIAPGHIAACHFAEELQLTGV